MTAVVDTNVVAALMLPTAASLDVAAQLRRDPDWRVPPLWRSEFRHVLLKHVAQQLNCRLLTFDRKLLARFPGLAEQPGS